MKATLIDKSKIIKEEHLVRFKDEKNREWFICVDIQAGETPNIYPSALSSHEFLQLPPSERNDLMVIAHDFARNK